MTYLEEAPMFQTSAEVPGLQWSKARRSVGNGACVEVAPAKGQIFIRDSQSQDGPIIRYSISSWRVFLKDVKTGLFDLNCL